MLLNCHPADRGVRHHHPRVPREAAQVRRGGHLSRQLEADHPRRHPARQQGVGRPGCVERRLLPDTQGPDRRGHVSEGGGIGYCDYVGAGQKYRVNNQLADGSG